MKLHIQTTDGNSFLALIDEAVSEEIAEKAESYVQTNIVEFGKFQATRGESDNFKHLVIYAANDAGKIVGFRYFFFEPSRSFCHLFATFVDADHRRNGIGTRLIEEAFAVAASHGCNEFEVRLTQPSPEKDALFVWYRRYAKENSHRFKFIIYYRTQMERYGYA